MRFDYAVPSFWPEKRLNYLLITRQYENMDDVAIIEFMFIVK